MKQFTAVLTLIAVFLIQIPHVRAFEAPVAPTAPPAPSLSTAAEEVASAQNAPSVQSVQETVSEPLPPPSAPTPPDVPTLQETPPSISPPPSLEEEEEDVTGSGEVDSVGQEQEGGSYDVTTQDSQSNPQGLVSSPLVGIAENGGVGEVTIQTGDASTTGLIVSTGNVNSTGAGGSAGDSVSVVNSENGESSDNAGSVSIITNTDTLQNNQADVGNTLSQSTVSGQNSASQNVGNSTIDSGDANTSGTVITAVNTNVDGVAVSEFTIADDHIGDIVLDFASSCISGCGDGGLVVAKNVENGANSDNLAHIDETSNTNTFQTNDATVESTLTLASDSGNNTASENTNGDSTIETGDANVVGNVLNFVNNNLAGNVVFGVVNIFGDLVGDIILPEEALNGCGGCDSSVSVANTENGAGSQNTASVSQTDNNTTFQSNDATIENNLILSASSGDNKASQNTGGSTEITTGDSTVDAQVLNVANSNVDGGDWWLVLVNEAGRWVGRILGAPEGANYAGSQGTEFVVNENGEITAVNSGNGASSQNTASVSQTTNNTTVQTNNAHVVNNIALSANTGGNSASQNTGGNSSITTGDAHVIANLVNFVNNNITGGGKLVVTVVNVFGSWIGDFVTPGTQKTKEVAVDTTPPVGAGPQPVASSGTTPGNNGTTNPSSSNSQETPSVGGNPGAHSNTGNSGPQNQSNVVPSTNPISTNASSFPTPTTQTGASTFIASVDGEPSDEILGAITEKDSPGPKKQIAVNLAWFALFIPLVLALILFKKKALLKRILPQRFTN